MQSTSKIRRDFSEFVGDQERYLKFVRHCNDRKGSFLFWQDRLWSDFVTIYPKYPVVYEDVIKHFRFCDIHSTELEVIIVKGFPGSASYDHDYEQDYGINYPYSQRIPPMWTSGKVERMLCETCRKLHDKKYRKWKLW